MSSLNAPFPCELKRAPRRRTIAIRVALDDRITVIAPERAPLYVIHEILHDKARWVERRLEHNKAERAARDARAARRTQFAQYLGEELALTFFETRSRRVDDQVRRTASGLSVGLPPELAGPLRDERIATALDRWMRARAGEIIPERVRHYAERLGLAPRRITLKTLKSKWGSCSSLGNLNFNWKLIRAPLPVIDYLAVHELCHLRHHNHSPAFWAAVAREYPQYKEQDRWLNQAGRIILEY